MGMEQLNAINERIHQLHQQATEQARKAGPSDESDPPSASGQDKTESENAETASVGSAEVSENKGRVLFDATACPQDIAYPTDLDLLNEARKKSEDLIDILYKPDLLPLKPRTYRRKARKDYLNLAQKRNKSKKAIRNGVRKQLG